MNHGAYKNIAVELEKSVVTDEMIEAQIQNALNANPAKVEKGVISEGDSAVFDFKGLKDGVAFPGGTAENYTMVIGSHQFIPGFEEQMYGMKKGEFKAINVTFPENYGATDLAGQPVVFEVTVHEIFNEVPAELNDAFVASLKLPNVETVEQLRSFLGEYLNREATKQDKIKIQDQVFDVLLNMVGEDNLPEAAIENALQQQVQRISMELMQQGATLEQYLQMIGQTMDDLNEQLKGFAKKQVRLEIALSEVAELEGLAASEEELAAQYDLMAKTYQVTVDELKAQVTAEELAKELTLMKASQFVVDAANITYK